MSSKYKPDEGAAPDQPWDIAFLSQRDLGLQIPVDFVALAGVSLSAACFGKNVYGAQQGSKCLSNLLAAGFRRFVWDLYWDASVPSWNFCPAQIPGDDSSSPTGTSTSNTDSTSSTSISSTSRASSTATVDGTTTRVVSSTTSSSAGVNRRDFEAWPAIVIARSAKSNEGVRRRQASSLSSSSMSRTSSGPNDPSSTTSSSTTSSAQPSATQSSGSSDAQALRQIGPYQCSTGLDLPLLVSVLADYLSNSSTNIGAYTITLTLNLHVASPADNPRASAQKPDGSDLPQESYWMSSQLRQNLSDYMYTPRLLRTERSDLNTGWYDTPFRYQPDTQYYNATKKTKGTDSTTNGWPSEGYVEFRKLLRLMAEFGTIDPQLEDYDLSADEDYVFPPDYLRNERSVGFAKNGTISRGCFLDWPGQTVAKSNNSWATTVIDTNILQLNSSINSNTTFPSLTNITSCGMSMLVNDTLLNETADSNIRPYGAIALSSIWSWAPGEPRDVPEGEEDSSRKRCAVMDLKLGGRWRVENCNSRHHAACRVDREPFSWQVSDDKGTYAGMSASGCGDDLDFSVPRTGLENLNLYSTFQSSNTDSDDLVLWVDFNSLDTEFCWVRGINETCPYRDTTEEERTRKLVVPIIAALVILIVAAFMLLVKCAANRQSNKKKRIRKGDDGWDYEGVPS